MIRQLPIVTIGKKQYYRDDRLGELRNIKNIDDRLIYLRYRSPEENIEDFKILEIIKSRDREVWWIEKNPDEFESMVMERNTYGDMSDEEFAEFVIKSCRENSVIITETVPNQNYDFDKLKCQICPVCGETSNCQTGRYYHDKILDVWICWNHGLDEIQKHIELKDCNLITYIKAEEQGKTIFVVPLDISEKDEACDHGY
jgi:hypothetical protein